MIPVFITGVGTDIGKTLVSAIVAAALRADYWKPVQAGSADHTDTHYISNLLGDLVHCHKESYLLKKAASPHIAAREEKITVTISKIYTDFAKISTARPAADYLVIEGAGGLLVPLNEIETVADLSLRLGGKVIIVSRNYLGSINHSLLTAEVCRQKKINTVGWIFTDEYMAYEEEISRWSNLPVLGKIPFLQTISRATITEQADIIRGPLLAALK